MLSDELAGELSIQVDRRPFLLRPERPPEGEPRRLNDGETEDELSPAMKERAEGVGLVMRRPKWSPNTMRAHEATAHAKAEGKDGEFHHLLAAVYWGSGFDINDLGVLQGVAQAAGIDWGKLGPRLESGAYRDGVLREYEAAKEKDIGGTPTYMIGGELLKGDVSIDDLRDAIKSAAAG
tara:strand:- start:589 stop:1125 length:537 start_codon:yes stop_codon:yes gene_type:complete